MIVLGACVFAFGMLGRTAGQVLLRPAAVTAASSVTIEDPYRTGGLPVDWLKGNLQAATVRGVGRDLPRALGDFYGAAGYQFLGISDLNTYTWAEEYQSPTLIAVPMIEASYPFGNLLALATDHWLPASSLQGAIDWINHDGGFPILAAPHSAERSLSEAEVIRLRNLFAIEVYDARLALTSPSTADATGLWDRMLSRGAHVFAFAGDDVMSLRDASAGPRAFIEVLAPGRDLSSLLAALQQGAFYASTGPAFSSLRLDGRTITVEAPQDVTVRFIGRGGRLLAAASGPAASYSIRGSEGYVRIELQSPGGGRAWSQPYFIN